MVGTGQSEHAFSVLELSPSVDLSTRETSIELRDGTAVHAIDRTGLRHLLLPLAPEYAPVEDHQSRGVTITTRTLVDGEVERRFIDVRCDDFELRDLFSIVCDEVLDGCRSRPDASGEVALSVLERWRDLLGPASSRLLSLSEVKGLLAELHFLEALAELDSIAALELWTGPDASRHDFIGESVVVEVKASSLVDEVRVHINGLTQLESPPGKVLYLLVERMERVPVGGDAIPDVITRLTSAGVSSASVLRLLSQRRVVPADLDSYSRIRFSTLERRVYIVDEAFPRLVPSLLEGTPAVDRVVRVEYVLDLGAQPPTPQPVRVVDALPRALLGLKEDVG